jgi:hypothetical protein
MSNNKIQVRLQDGTIGVPDKFLVYGIEYDTQSEAKEAIKSHALLNIRTWFYDWTSVDRFLITDEIARLDKANINKLIELLTQLT